MPIFVDGVEINSVWVDGVEQDSVWVDGVEVFTGFTGETYIDTFTDVNGTLVANHIMNTGQQWTVSTEQVPPTIQNGTLNAAGKQVAAATRAGQLGFTLAPITGIVNDSFVARASYNWQLSNPLAAQGLIYLDYVDSLTRINVQNVFATTQCIFYINDVTETKVFAALDQTGVTIEYYYDSVDIACVCTAYPSGERIVFPRQPATGVVNVSGRRYNINSSPIFGSPSITLQLFDVSEIATPPGDIPWPT